MLDLHDWRRERILVLGMTYPHYSKKYQENVCTGALLESTREMIRIHPIPRRYMDAKFKNFQWITASISKHPHDPRPESCRIDPNSIELHEEIPSTKPELRRALLESSPHLMSSYEALKARNESQGTSLGIIRPKEITGCRLEKRPSAERAEWAAAEKELLRQTDLFERAPLPIDFPEVRFMVRWVCDDAQCKGHEMGMEQWGLHELYRKLRGDTNCETKILSAMNRRLDSKTRDIFLFLGSFRTIMYNFGLMDSYDAPKVTTPGQLNLLGSA